MRRYIFLDNWVLSNYTKGDNQNLLSAFIYENNLTVIINTLSLIELYNPGWQQSQGEDRTIKATEFLSRHSSVIVDPVKVFKAEIQEYPNRLKDLPIELDLDSISIQHRKQSLLMFLRGDNIFAEQGKDIRIWDENYKRLKSTWIDDITKIIDDACQKGSLIRDKKGQFCQLEMYKEKFLLYLDRRHFGHFSADEIEKIGSKIVELFMGGLSQLPSIRFTSLCFWFAYVQTDRTHPMAKKPSDIGDFFQMSLVPYCSIFSTDNTMCWLAQRIKQQMDYTCKVVNKKDLDTIIKGKKWIGALEGLNVDDW